jgi:glucose/arabinose dehydrogenase
MNRILHTASAVLLAAAPAFGAQQVPMRTQLVAEGLDIPTQAAFAPGFPHVLVVAEKAGRIQVVRDGAILPQPLLDLTGKVTVSQLAGLQGLIFHPRYAENGWFYVHYQSGLRTIVVERYTVPVPASFSADPQSALVVVGPISEPIAFHCGGGLAFDAEERLYVGIGDRRLELPEQSCIAQDPTTLLGKLLRIEADGAIPAANPLVGVPGARAEIFALGLRQPYRVSVDLATGGVVIGEVGEGQREEVNFIPPGTTRLLNFGWQVLEGEQCTLATSCQALPCPNPALDEPVYSYVHDAAGNCSVTGGHVYRGGAIPSLFGYYLAADWCSGRIWGFRISSSAQISGLVEISQAIAPTGGLGMERITALTEDPAGELYFVDMGQGVGALGEVYKLLPATALAANRDFLSLASGGEVHFTLAAGAPLAGLPYLLLGSLSGTAPGIGVGLTTLPLQPDAYFLTTLSAPNSTFLPQSLGLLDAEGGATCSFLLPPGLSPSLQGAKVWHAFVVVAPSPVPQVVFASGAEAVKLLE